MRVWGNELLCIAEGNVKLCSQCEKAKQCLKKLKHRIVMWFRNHTAMWDSHKHKYTKVHSSTTYNNHPKGERLKCLPPDELINNVVYMYKRTLFSLKKQWHFDTSYNTDEPPETFHYIGLTHKVNTMWYHLHEAAWEATAGGSLGIWGHLGYRVQGHTKLQN